MRFSNGLFLLITSLFMACNSTVEQYASFEDYPVYDGDDLGLTYAPEQSTFKVWSPAAESMMIQFYEQGHGTEPPILAEEMKQDQQGVWTYTANGDQKGTYYTFKGQFAGNWNDEVPDPYAVAVGENGKRAMVVDLKETNPDGWEQDQKPALENFTDIIIYELHVRDLSMDEQSGIQNKGKFLGLTESGTQTPEGITTGLDHIKDLGVTHIHLLPSFDYMSIDESKLSEHNFNWGYDPQNYNVPEGSYSTNPQDGAVRIKEFKQMVKTLHDNGLRVILDVVYNHTGATETSNFNQIAPGYYYRQDSLGNFSNASACGNETASDRPMMRKFMVESILHWVNEYHLDGFRFDLMGIHDIETMNAISKAVRAVDPTIFIYGEGWTAGASPLPDERKALKMNTRNLDGIAAFSDDIRDAIKGHVFTHDAKGFASGLSGLEESVKFGIVASTKHPQIDYGPVNYSDAPWANHPTQTITYVSCHDNHTLWDRLTLSCPNASEAEKIRMHKLAGAMVLTAQGVSFLHAGSEMARTKGGDENSYKSPDAVNRIDWARKAQFQEVYDYYKGLIQLRKNHPAFRMPTTAQVVQHLQFLDINEDNLLAYQIKGNANGDSWENILVIYNGNPMSRTITIPANKWTVVVDDQQINESGIREITTSSLDIPASSAMILIAG